MVNVEGNRFCDDYFPDYTQLSKWIMEQPGDNVFVVFDQKVVDDSKRIQEFKESGFFFEGETLEELAEMIGVPVDNLKGTMEDYAKTYDRGVDEKFARTVAINSRLDQAPFYAVKSQPGIQVTLVELM